MMIFYVLYDLFGVHIAFFFQAEDGIRDLTVTGVQTCALPILASAVALPIHADEGVIAVAYAEDADERSEEHTSELQSQSNLVCRLLLEKKKKKHGRRVRLERA